MPDEKKPGDFTFGTNERGDLLIDGIVVERNMQLVDDPPPVNDAEGDEEPKGKKNAVAEGEEFDKETVPEPPKEPEKSVEPTEPPTPEPPKIPEKQKYKLHIRGEIQEKEYTNDEIVARLQMAESYGIRNDELREKHKKIEPYLNVFERPDFKEWLESKVAMGDIPAPQPAPPPSSDAIRYRLRAQEPEFVEIQSQIAAWAATLPDQEMEVLNSDYKAFVEAYDHFKSTRKNSAATLPPSPVVNKNVEKSIANKEVIKQQARVEPPGGAAQEPPDPKKEYAKVERTLRKAVQSGEKYVIYNGKRMEPDIALIMHTLG